MTGAVRLARPRGPVPPRSGPSAETGYLYRQACAPVPHADPAPLLIEHCAQRSLLLIRDNCEPVIDAAAQLAETLLTHCPSLKRGASETKRRRTMLKAGLRCSSTGVPMTTTL